MISASFAKILSKVSSSCPCHDVHCKYVEIWDLCSKQLHTETKLYFLTKNKIQAALYKIPYSWQKLWKQK